ncbi:MAG: tRNA pseudouridine(55) synthase TruB [Myxococcota bacterium]
MAKPISDGILLVDKPKGLTSFDCVAQTRRLFQTKSVGHTGTLDPFATGLLVLLLGRYTRLSPYLTSQDKTYEAEVCLGIGTDTDDCEGQVIAQADASHLTSEAIDAALQSFLGAQMQIPPQYSAISINGERAYKKARRGEEVAYEPRPVMVYDLTLNPSPESGEGLESAFSPSPLSGEGLGVRSLNIRLRVSKGTYIRAIARDLGAKLGVPAHLTNLRRTQSGSYDVSEVNGDLLTGLSAIRGIPLLEIDTASAEALKQGKRPMLAGLADQSPLLAHVQNEPVAIAKIEEGHLVTIRGF